MDSNPSYGECDLWLEEGRQVTVYCFGGEPKEDAVDALLEGYEISEGMRLPDGVEISIVPTTPNVARFRGYGESDPDFEGAIATFAEAAVGGHDSLDGEAIDLAKDTNGSEAIAELLLARG